MQIIRQLMHINWWFMFMAFNATFNNISVISWRSVLLVEESGENYRHVASTYKLYHIMLYRIHLAMINLNLRTIQLYLLSWSTFDFLERFTGIWLLWEKFQSCTRFIFGFSRTFVVLVTISGVSQFLWLCLLTSIRYRWNDNKQLLVCKFYCDHHTGRLRHNWPRKCSFNVSQSHSFLVHGLSLNMT